VTSAAPRLTFHEGQACDAVLRRIEKRECGQRKNLSRPEVEGTIAPIDLTCEINGTLFAIEHTGIEPFEGHLRLDAQAKRSLRPIEAALTEQLQPAERVVVTVPWDAFLNKKGRGAEVLQKALVALVVRVYGSIPVDRPGRRARAVRIPSEINVPFEIFVDRSENSGFPGKVIVACSGPDNFEAERSSRLKRVYESHARKLETWKSARNARTILILEEADIQTTREDLVADALQTVEQNAEAKPDEVWLVSTAVSSIWHSWWLRVGQQYCEDLSYRGNSLSEVDPRTLVRLTER